MAHRFYPPFSGRQFLKLARDASRDVAVAQLVESRGHLEIVSPRGTRIGPRRVHSWVEIAGNRLLFEHQMRELRLASSEFSRADMIHAALTKKGTPRLP